MYSLIGLGLVLFLSACGSKKQMASTIINTPFTIDLFNKEMNDSVSCYRIPALITAPNGDLIAAIDERVPSCGDLKWSKDINIVLRRSSDNGTHWGPIETIVDFPLGQSASDPSFILDQETKTLFLFYNYMDLDKEKDVYYLHYVKSTDNGKSWSKPIDITAQIAKPEWHGDFKFITSGRGIQTQDGTLLHCMVNLDNGMHVFGSKDHGNTWFLNDVPIAPANESKIIELSDGQWMVNARTNKKGHRYIHLSNDKGKTWKSHADSTLIDPGCNASIIRYSSKAQGDDKDRLLFSNAKSVDKRIQMTVRISYDEGKTWSDGKTIDAGFSAYSSMTVLDNGQIGLFYEAEKHASNPFTRFSLEWLTDGVDKTPKKYRKR
ncbi:sialidase [Sediminicola luteus]|uniref:exo-alpha-sialidase n=1 Tax=Sediminicola luteus TaxID=319238 RepID=A0A2A4G583_9FLAO|nr:sialidase [Sediminicola luteus]